MHIDPKISAPSEPGLADSRVPGLAEPHGRFRPNHRISPGTFRGWGPKLG